MRVLRNTEWEPIGWVEKFPGIGGPAYLFRHEQYGDVVALKVVKWIDVPHNIVYFYDAEAREVSACGRGKGHSETSLPRYHMALTGS